METIASRQIKYTVALAATMAVVVLEATMKVIETLIQMPVSNIYMHQMAVACICFQFLKMRLTIFINTISLKMYSLYLKTLETLDTL